MTTPVLAQTDFYKVHHPNMFPVGTELMYNNLTPRKSRLSGVNAVVVFGVQYWVIEYLIKQWNYNFFHLEMRSKFTPDDQEWKDCKDKTIGKYKRLMDFTCGKDTVPTKHLEDLWDLGYMPLHIKALDEG
jgi:nicotinamide phosphoribosyltransferase